MRGISAACSGLLAILLGASRAAATPGFPATMQDHLGLSYQPPCGVCHEGGRTGNGTVTTPFGRSLLEHGLHAGSDGSLTNALDALAADGVDSDSDGTPDIDELGSGSDPNVEGGESLLGPTPAYGCGARIAPGDSSATPAVPFLGLLVLGGCLSRLFFRRRRFGVR